MSDERAEEEANQRRTPETRARIRHWDRRQNLAVGFALVGIALPIVAIALMVLLQHTKDESIFHLLMWMIGAGAVFFVVSVLIEIHAQSRLLEARFADAYVAVGMIYEVIEVPSEGASTYTLMITAALPGRGSIRRMLDSNMYPSGPGAKAGGHVLFRHNTREPDNLSDVLFVRFS